MEPYEIKPIRNAIVMLTNQCNCNCTYCFEERRSERMGLEIAKDTLSFLHRSGSDRVGFTFFGGEPMMEFDRVIVPLVEWSKTAFNSPTRFAMTTNGTLLSKERLDFLKENNISFMLSMDGSRTAQSGNRPLKDGRNSFDVVMENVPYILKLWPMQSFRETLTQYNADSFFEDMMFFNSIGCANLMVVPDIFEMWSDEKIKMLEEQIKLYEQYILEQFRSGVRPFLIHEYSVGFKQIIAAHNCARDGIARRSGRGCAGYNQCGFGVKGSVSIDPTGDIYGCHHIKPLNHDSPFYLGNIYDGVDEQRVRSLVALYDPQSVGNEQCKNCGLDGFCNGGCAPNNYQIMGDVNNVPPMYCIWQRLIADSAYRIMTTLCADGNKLFNDVFVDGATAGW